MFDIFFPDYQNQRFWTFVHCVWSFMECKILVL